MPYTEEVLLGYDVKVGKLWTVGLTAVYRNQKDILVQNDPGWSNPAYVADTLDLVSPISNQPFKAYVTDRKLGDPNNGHSYYITNSSDAKNLYRMLTVSVERALANRWSFYGAMTWAKSEGNYNTTAAQDVNNFNDPNFKFNSYGKLPYVNDKEARVRATYEFPWAWKTRVSGTYTYLSGERYTPLIDLSNNTFELNQNALTVFGTPRGSAKYPSRHLLDIRFSQELNVSSKVKAEAFLDVFNALNECKSYNWNQVAADDAADYGVLGASSGYTQPINVDDPRRLRIGFKLKF
jgi:hypothetical protein